MKKNTVNGLTLLSGICLSCCLLTNNTKAAVLYWDNNGTSTPSGGVWDATSTDWASSSTLTASTIAWNPADAAVFTAGGTSAGNIEVDVNTANLGTAGIFNNGVAGSSCNLTLGGTGSLSLDAGDDAFYVSPSKSTTVNTLLTGAGILDAEGTGSLYLNAANSYTGGTYLGNSGNTLLYFNNSSAFGTGDITLNRTGNFSTLLATGGATITLANNFSINAANTGPSTALNFASAANTAVVSTGTWSLGTVNLDLRNNGDSTAPLTINGVISGSGKLTISGANGGTIHLGVANTYTGTTTIGESGDTAITLELGAQNAIASSSGLILAGGILKLAGYDETIGALQLTADSTIDFGSGDPTLTFGDSSGETWTGTLNLLNYDPNTDKIYFGTDGSGLTQDQLNEILDNGATHSWVLGSDGLLELAPVPEPSTLALSALGVFGGLGIWLRRRKA